ncbi:MAG: hypothetical protein RL301_180 [Actinomycetota bacterium]
MALKFSTGIVNSDALVVGLAKSKTGLVIESGKLKLADADLLPALNDLGATGAVDEVIKLPGSSTKVIIFSGLGEAKAKYHHETIRRAAGAAARSLFGLKSATFSIADDQRANAEGAAIASYNFTNFLGDTKKEQKAPLAEIIIFGAGNSQILKRAEIEAKYVHLVRDLINTPPSHLNPTSFVSQLTSLAKSVSGVKVKSWNEKELKSGGFGGITAVGQGSANPPRLLHLSYTPAKAKKRYAFVGKGITFDSGGLALKPAKGMETMKCDMSGAAAVCAAVLAIAEMKLPVAIDAWAPLAENMVSDTATRPSDIIKIYGGKTVEVLNPDAEGRLVLADALMKAQEVKNLDGIIDVATLTGAQMIALGTRTSGVMTNDEKFCAEFMKATENTGELFWPMPLPEELRPSLDSPVADIANIGDRNGGMLVAGLFLREFVSNDLPWLHLDIAGPAFNEGSAHGYTPKGGTGVAVRTLIEFVS